MEYRALMRTIWTTHHPLIERPFARWCVVLSASALVGAWIAIAAIPVIPGDASVVVHYTTTFGIDALGRWTEILWLPAAGTIAAVANVTIAWFGARPPERARARVAQWAPAIADVLPILLVATLLIALLTLVGSLLLMNVNNES